MGARLLKIIEISHATFPLISLSDENNALKFGLEFFKQILDRIG